MLIVEQAAVAAVGAHSMVDLLLEAAVVVPVVWLI
jgi:hypothetical protein